MEDDDLTREEAEITEDEGVTGEVAHREGEFDDLRDLLSRIDSRISDLETSLKSEIESIKENATAIAVENGATVREDDDDLDFDVIPELDELDLKLD